MSIKISVITICFNNLDELLETCTSVDRQQVLPYEHIIIDGSTKPGIKDYLSAQPQPPYRKWISEPDKGIADAFNKGVNMATGDIINMLNSGDHYLNDNILSTVTNAFRDNPSIQWLHSKFRLQRGNKWVIIGKPFDPRKLYRGMRSISHQSMFVRKELHHKYGLYDITLKNVMDYDFLCRIRNEKFLFFEEPFVVFIPGGTTYVNYLYSLAEMKKVYTRHFGYSLKMALWQVRLKFLFYLLNSKPGKWLYKLKVWLKLENY